jgi:hypothetical protein
MNQPEVKPLEKLRPDEVSIASLGITLNQAVDRINEQQQRIAELEAKYAQHNHEFNSYAPDTTYLGTVRTTTPTETKHD